MSETTIDDVRAVVADVDATGAAETVDVEASLLAAGIVDSMAMVELITALERRFAIRLTEDDLVPENFETLRAMRDLVERKRGGTTEERR